jgi:predicted nucleic-acid-binding protein
VLERSYRQKRAEIAGVLTRLLHSRHLVFTAAEKLARALEAYGRGKAQFADYLIREDARATGCTAVATFDGGLLEEPGFLAP